MEYTRRVGHSYGLCKEVLISGLELFYFWGTAT